MTPKDELLTLQQQAQAAKQAAREIEEECEQIDNEALIRRANGIVNERFFKIR